MAIDLTCDISSKRITPGVINLKEFENGTTSMVWTVSSRYTTGLVDLNDFDAYLNLSIRGHIDQIKLTKVLNVDDSISLTWDVGTLSTFLVGDADVELSARTTSIKTLEWEHIHEALAASDFNISEAARRLGLHRRTLARKLEKRRVK